MKCLIVNGPTQEFNCLKTLIDRHNINSNYLKSKALSTFFGRINL